MERRDDPQLWDMLGRSKAPAPSPFFARNVVRAVRNDQSVPAGLASWFQLRRLVPTLSAITALVIAAFTFQILHNHRSVPAGQPMIASADVAQTEATDFEVLSGDEDSDDAPLL